MQFIAHIRESDQKTQTVKEHLLQSKELAESYGEKMGIKHVAGLSGLLHDLGKLTKEFQTYIIEVLNTPDSPPKRGSVDHSTVGGRLLYSRFHTGSTDRYKRVVAEVVGNAIISHHAYLQDFLTPDFESPYVYRVRDKQAKELESFEELTQHFFQTVMNESDFEAYVNEAANEIQQFLAKEPSDNPEKPLMFLAKFIFSVLIDADRTNTRRFEEGILVEPELNHKELFKNYTTKLLEKINLLQENPHANLTINLLRSEMSYLCEEFAKKPSGIYTLSIPTGGGKTLASLRYALEHAKQYNKKRIIYVVPYTTIIEQNAEEIRNLLKDDEHILEHHSNVVEEANKSDEHEEGRPTLNQKWKLASDNWDTPIILTTMVQFLNVFYAKGSRSSRRLHNLSETVIVFDEVQKVPVSCVSLFNEAVNFLKKYAHTSILLCTATQPALDFVRHKLEIDGEIVQNLDRVIDAFQRVEIMDKATKGTFNTHELSDFIKERMGEGNSMLVILNTKSVVKRLYQLLQSEMKDVPIYHLSTNMCAAHRKKVMEEIKKYLETKQRVICISTPLIEAGVDISFEYVVRSLAGLDSIAQAAGRCNRHGEREKGTVYLIDHVEEKLDLMEEVQIGKWETRKLLVDLKHNSLAHGGHLLSQQAMAQYFKRYYARLESKLHYFIQKFQKNMTELLMVKRAESTYRKAYQANYGKDVPLMLVNSYHTAADHFRVIDQNTTSVFVPYGEGEELLLLMSQDRVNIQDLSQILKKAQRYMINVYPKELEILKGNDLLESILDGSVWILKKEAYHEEMGLQ
ncbi:MAG TPA: CRISPR-associated helicase Cas3', partial [Bacillota bacterium]|nr:CRISPR-associated helicase Cas3' [Bacillota bacterium]